MKIDTATAIRIYRRLNGVATPLLSGCIGDMPHVERRVVRVMGWLGGLSGVLRFWVLDPALPLPEPGSDFWCRGGNPVD